MTHRPLVQTPTLWLVPMRARRHDEPVRSATPLELLFDLTFVVAVAAVAAQLAQALADGDLAHGALGYLTVFFAIWWAWVNFTWFASAYDTDDVPYRLLTLLQMAGVLVLAEGVPAAFDDQNFVAPTVGYVIMRAAMLVQWVRAARGDPARSRTTWPYVWGSAALQIGWLLRLLLPPGLGLLGLVALAAAELALPWWAEHRGGTTWHPHHIAERYGLFTIIVLGECVLASATAIAPAVHAGVTLDLVLVAAGGLVMVFAAWWLYFLKHAGEGLARRRHHSFWWGYGHYGVFASLAAVGAGLEVAAESLAHHVNASGTLIAGALALSLSVFMMLVWALHAPLSTAPASGLPVVTAASVATLGVAAATAAGLPLPWAVLGMSLPISAIVALHVARDHERAVTAT